MLGDEIICNILVGLWGLEPQTSSLYPSLCSGLMSYPLNSNWWAMRDLNLRPRHYQ